MTEKIEDPGRRSLLKTIGGGLVTATSIAGGIAGTAGAVVSYEALREAREASEDAAKIRDNTTAIASLAGEFRSEQIRSAERSLRLLELQIQLVEVQRSIVPPTQRTADGVEAIRKLMKEMQAEKAALHGSMSRNDRVMQNPRRAATERKADTRNAKAEAAKPFGMDDPAPHNSAFAEKIFGR